MKENLENGKKIILTFGNLSKKTEWKRFISSLDFDERC